jgi:outer membrane protein
MRDTLSWGKRVRRAITGVSLSVTTLCVGLALASPSFAEDLVFHYQRALESDPKFQGARANRDAVSERRAQAQAGFFPTIGATASRNRHDEEVITDSTITSRPTGQARYSSSEYRLNLSQPVYNATLLSGWRAADADLQRAEAEYAASRQELMLRVAQAYFDVLLAQETLSLVRAEKDTLARQLDSAQVRLNAGAGSITDVHDTRARFQTVLAQEIEIQNQLDDKREALRELSGEAPGSLANLHKEMPLISPEPADMKRWTETAANQNLVLQAAKAAEESARQAIAQNRAGHYPTLNLVGSRTRTDADASIPGPGVRSDESILGLQLNVPIFQGGLVNAKVNEATYRYEAARQEVEAKRRAVERGTRAAFQGVTGARAKIEALEQTVAAAGASLTAKSEGYRAGVYTTVDVLDATRDLYRAQRDYAEARHNYVLSLLQLKLAAGTLNDDDLSAIINWLHR